MSSTRALFPYNYPIILELCFMLYGYYAGILDASLSMVEVSLASQPRSVPQRRSLSVWDTLFSQQFMWSRANEVKLTRTLVNMNCRNKQTLHAVTDIEKDRKLGGNASGKLQAV